MAKQYDKNLQIINNLDVQLNIFRDKAIKLSVLKNFVSDFSNMNGQTYSDDDIDMICEALEFLDVVIVDDSDEIASSPAPDDAELPEPSSDSAPAKIDGTGISYGDIEVELNELLNPKKLDFSELARTRSSADLCKLILDNPDNYIKVMYAIRKQL